jgi:hypothetical protein
VEEIKVECLVKSSKQMTNECVVCYENIDEGETVWWVVGEDQPDEQSGWCWECATNVLQNHYQRWFKGVEKADCAAALRRLIKTGPPMTMADAVEEMTQPIRPGFGELRVRCGNKRISGKLQGCPLKTWEARDAYCEKLKERLQVFEAVEAAEKQEK